MKKLFLLLSMVFVFAAMVAPAWAANRPPGTEQTSIYATPAEQPVATFFTLPALSVTNGYYVTNTYVTPTTLTEVKPQLLYNPKFCDFPEVVCRSGGINSSVCNSYNLMPIYIPYKTEMSYTTLGYSMWD